MLKVKDLTKYYGDQRILNRISFDIQKEHKIALVGFNGVGKSTLLKILAGIESPDKGQINYNKNISVGFLPQDPEKHNKEIAIDYLKKNFDGEDDDTFRRNIEIMLAGFVLDSEIKNKKIGELSSGQKNKIFLISVLLKKPDLLLLDEPTNNLDLPALIWLENYLKNFQSAFVVISHDKKFLDNISNKVYEINWVDRTLEISNGKYSDYLTRKSKEKKRQQLDYKLQKEDINRLNKLAKEKQEKAAKGAKYISPDNDHMLQGYRRNRSANSLRDSKVIYNRIKRMDKVEKPENRKDFVIDIDSEKMDESRDIILKKIVCGYDDFEIGPIDLEILSDDRITILGLNGSGKTTLLKIITGVLKKKSGDLEVGEGVKFGNLMQEHEILPRKKTIIKFLSESTGNTKKEIEVQLDFFGFNKEEFEIEIAKLSPGVRARLLLVYFSLINVNTLVLDEPTNHLDLEAIETLDKTLKKFKGTVILVTHDRSLVEGNMVQKKYLLDNGSLIKIDDFNSYVEDMTKKSRKLIRMLK